jgi:hypothetical protein
MNLKKCLLALVAGSVFFVSCSSDDDNNNIEPTGAYKDGTFILNEGNSAPSTASVTFLGDNGSVENDIYTSVNPGKPGLGTYLQDLFFSDDKVFIISGSANKVTVVNRYTFEYIATVDTNLENPRYGAVSNGKAYITNYASSSTGADDFLTVINLSDYSTSKVALNNWSEKIIEENGKLYISNGFYGSGTSITVFNPSTNATERVIELGASPESFEEEDGILYVLGGGKLSRINLATNQVSGSITLPEAFTYSAQNLSIEDNKLYFTSSTSVYSMPLNSVTIPTTPLLTYTSTSEYGAMYGFSVNDGKIYIADGGDFSSDSEIYTYSLTGTLLNAYTVGVGPNGFYFND